MSDYENKVVDAIKNPDLEIPVGEEEKPLPVEYKFNTVGTGAADLEVQAKKQADSFFGAVEYSLRIEVHDAPRRELMGNYIGHVTATKKVNWSYHD